MIKPLNFVVVVLYSYLLLGFSIDCLYLCNQISNKDV